MQTTKVEVREKKYIIVLSLEDKIVKKRTIN